MLKEQDFLQLEKKGISKDLFEMQIRNFENGFPFSNLQEPATTQKGILRLKKAEIDHFIHLYEVEKGNKNILKFVPASGVASRMFKNLADFVNNNEKSNVNNKDQFSEVKIFIEKIQKFAFYEALKSTIKEKGTTIEELIENKDYRTIIIYLLTKYGLNYGNLPKALLSFHSYKGFLRTALEEQLIEGIEYAKNDSKNVFVHFTISPEHKKAFTKKIREIKKAYETEFDVKLHIQLSEQKSSTDIVAVDDENRVVRNRDGSMMFRPGGHGALIENLNECNADIIFIKNIDNVVVDSLKEITCKYKKALAGYLLDFQKKIFQHLTMLDNLEISESELSNIEAFGRHSLSIIPEDSYYVFSFREKIAFWQKWLNRPIRVCGMVKNQGETGGGPFWVKNEKGEISLQIVESSQIDFTNNYQKEIAARASHFNPVDLVCGIKDYRGNKFDLRFFIDKSTGFICFKPTEDKIVKAQELPGLWNGAMANWISIFIEVPIETFNPVKTVTDLLRKEHQQ